MAQLLQLCISDATICYRPEQIREAIQILSSLMAVSVKAKCSFAIHLDLFQILWKEFDPSKTVTADGKFLSLFYQNTHWPE